MLSSARLLLLAWTVTVLLSSDEVDGLRGSALVLQAKAKAAELKANPTEAPQEVGSVDGETDVEASGNETAATAKPKRVLTGIPQKDYIYDPNLPRELNGENLTSYPFYSTVPADIEFDCDGLHDGFYASVPHKCQVYHHCLFGTRYDFLCANYTAFDQRTFICHFVSEVDCDNSPKFFKRNEALYQAASTTTAATTTTSTTTTTTAAPPSGGGGVGGGRRGGGGRRRPVGRPYRRRRPVYEYYYDDEAYDEPEYYEDDPAPPPRKSMRKHRPGGRRAEADEEDTDYEASHHDTTDPPKDNKPTVRPSGPAAGSVYDRPRVPPKVRRPVPINERDKYDYTQKTSDAGPPPTKTSQKERKPAATVHDDEYYDDDYEEEHVEDPKNNKKVRTTEKEQSRMGGRPNRRRQQQKPRPYRQEEEEEEDYYVEERPRRKGNRNNDRRPMRGGHRSKGRGEEEVEEAVPAERPGYISRGTMSPRRRVHDDDRRRQPDRRPSYEEEDDEYYDDEEEEPARRTNRPQTMRSGNGSKQRGRENEESKTQEVRTNDQNKPVSRTNSKDDNDQRPSSRSNTKANVPVRGVKDEIKEPKYDEDEYEDYDVKPPKTVNRGIEQSSRSNPTTTEVTKRIEPTTKIPSIFRSQGQDVRSNFRSRTSTEQIPITTSVHRFSTTTAVYDDYSEEEPPPRFNVRNNMKSDSKLRPAAVNAYKKNTTPLSVEIPKVEKIQPIEPGVFQMNLTQGRVSQVPSPRPFAHANFLKRPAKTTTTEEPTTIAVEVTTVPQTSEPPYVLSRRPSKLDEGEKNPSGPGFIRRPAKINEKKLLPVEFQDKVESPQIQPSQVPEAPKNVEYDDRYVPSSPGGYRKAIQSSSRQKEYTLDNSRPSAPAGALYRRPFLTRPEFSNANNPEYKTLSTPPKDYPEIGSKYRSSPKPKDAGTIVNLRSNYGFLVPRPKQLDISNPESYSREPAEFSLSLPKNLDITAPGPSAPANEPTTTQADYRQNDFSDSSGPTGFTLDIADEEYDVTLNDALQPSTLHPTRSLGDSSYSQTKVKTRGYQSTVTHPSSRGSATYLLPSASQQYLSKSNEPEQGKPVSEPNYETDKIQKDGPDEYEAVVLSATRYNDQPRWISQRQPQPTEWYW